MPKLIRIDACRLLCPLPVIRTQDAIAELEQGDQVQVTCTDPGTKHDIPSWSRINGHRVDSIAEEDGEIIFTVTVGEKTDS